MSKKYARNRNSIYATFLRDYQKAVAEFATQITVQSDEEQKPKYRRGVRASLALGGIGAGYALGKNPEAQEVLKNTATDVKDRAIDGLQDFRTKYNVPQDLGVKSLVSKVPASVNRIKEEVDNVALPNMFGNYDQRLERAAEAKQVANDLGLNPSRWFGGQ
jgi:hypothetical protein